MEYIPNNADLVKGETRKLTFRHAAGNNVVNSYTISCDGATFDTPVVNGTTVTAFGTFSKEGTFTVVGTAALASGETLIGSVEVKVRDPYCRGGRGGYD